MKIWRFLFVLLITLTFSFSAHAAYEGEDPGPYGSEKKSGFFIGTDQGVLFWVGNSSSLASAQFYSDIFGGYNIHGYIQPMFRLGQAIGNVSGVFFNPTSYFLIWEGGLRVTPLRTMVRPYISGTAGGYLLTFDSAGGAVVANEVNFTFSGGGGVEVAFGRSNMFIGGEYRGFQNSGSNLRGVSVSLGYYFQF